MAKVKVFLKVGQTSRSRSLGQKCWYPYGSPTSSGKELWPRLKFFSKVGQTSRSRSLGQKFWYPWKGLVTRNVHMKYGSPTSSG